MKIPTPQNNLPQSAAAKFLEGGGEMGQLIRDLDWGKHALGVPDTWPRSLLITLSNILNSKFPKFLFWGPNHFCFYNDAYRPSLGNNGKHPKALGQTGIKCWPEIWPVIYPLIEQVMADGESTWSEDQLIPIFRNNKIEDVYWTFSYSKVRDDDGDIAGVMVTCNETTDKVKTLKTLTQAKRELEMTIEAASLGTWDLDPKTNKFIGNNRLKEWFGLSPGQEADLQIALNAIIETDRDKVTSAIIDVLKKGSDGNYSIIYTIVNPATQVQRVVKATGKVIFDEEEEPVRFSGILQDVTDDYQLQQRKDEFISVASHELKTPLTTLNASMQILQKLMKADPASDKVPMFVNKANNSLNKLVHLLDDLLNVTKIQQGQLALNKTMFNITELINECCEHVRLDGEHELILTGDKELMVFADYRRIDQVLVNLVNNAVKYAPNSKKISIHLEHNNDIVTVSVKDYGIGINPEKLPHLFDRYYRVDALGHQFSGLGLGLYISSEIISRHGGKIGVESTRGEGSTFWFTLPLND